MNSNILVINKLIFEETHKTPEVSPEEFNSWHLYITVKMLIYYWNVFGFISTSKCCTHMYTCTHARTHARTHAHAHTHTHTHAHAHTHTQSHTQRLTGYVRITLLHQDRLWELSKYYTFSNGGIIHQWQEWILPFTHLLVYVLQNITHLLQQITTKTYIL